MGLGRTTGQYTIDINFLNSMICTFVYLALFWNLLIDIELVNIWGERGILKRANW
jgi:hypothetical protein